MRARTRLVTGLVAVVVVVGAVAGWGLWGAPPWVQHPVGAPQPPIGSSAKPSPHPRATAAPSATPTPRPTGSYLSYVAIGDSFAAGQGAGQESGPCLRSPQGYSGLLASLVTIEKTTNAACSGATTADVRDSQLADLTDSTNLVTLTVGGDDLGAIPLALSCARGVTSACQSQFKQSIALLQQMPRRLRQTYALVAAAAPNARIIVTGYPDLYRLPAVDSPQFSTIALINAATDSLDIMIKDAVTAMHAAGADITYVPISFTGHGIGDEHPWVNATGTGAFHPNSAGYRAFAKAIAAVL